MHSLEKLFLIVALIITTGLLMTKYFQIFLNTQYNLLDGQPTNVSQYACPVDDFTVQFTWSLSTHSAWEPSINCNVPLCGHSVNSTTSGCQSSSIMCFNYRTATNKSYCAPASLCSILEVCDNVTGLCSSNMSVCVANSCCTPQTVCLPLAWTHMCISSNDTSKFYNGKHIEFTLFYKAITVLLKIRE